MTERTARSFQASSTRSMPPLGNSRGFILPASALGALGLCLIAATWSLTGTSPLEGAAPAPLTVGFVYVGPKDDYGYCQCHAQAAVALKKLPNVTVLEEENVPETEQVQKVIKSLIEDRQATLIFPTSYGYLKPHVIKLAKLYPKVTFLHWGGKYDPKECSENISTYFGDAYECEYLSGVVAGYATKSKKLGFVSAKPIPQIRANINAFTLGARSVNPAITCKVIFTNDWSSAVKETQAVQGLVADGVDVVTCQVDNPKVFMQTAEHAGIMCCAFHTNLSELAPKGFLTGTEWNWEVVYADFVNKVQKGEQIPHIVRGGIKEGFVKLSPFGPSVQAEAKKKVEELKVAMMQGKFEVFKGPIKDDKGGMAVPEGKAMTAGSPELEWMSIFVEGVVSQ